MSVRIAVGARGRGRRRSCSCTGSATRAGAGSRSLDGLAERFEVILFDNRGIGESDVPPGPYTAAEMAADVEQVLDEAGVERAHVLGTSLGGMVAQELALDEPGARRPPRARLHDAGRRRTRYPLPERHAPSHRGGADARAGRGAAPLRRERARTGDRRGRPELVERIIAHRLAAPQDPAGWAAQAAAGVTFDALRPTAARSPRRRSCCTGRRTASSTSGTRTSSASGSRRRACRAVRRAPATSSSGSSPSGSSRRVDAFLRERLMGSDLTLGRWLSDRARNTPGAGRDRVPRRRR